MCVGGSRGAIPRMQRFGCASRVAGRSQARFAMRAADIIVRCDLDGMRRSFTRAPIAQLGERQTEDLKVPNSILCLGMF